MDGRESEHPIVIDEAGEQNLLDPVERRGCRIVHPEAESRSRASNLATSHCKAKGRYEDHNGTM